ncbi:hypothetical protein M0R89_11530 [Halorussus limi]|uniref:Uncharacterized protein n=1 Tax=Halorussus limi TaxID=2938695 RepID=A0A8U0HQL4_9EURY|nr:hypothetical protein [Halorussus limi]UPV73178.1 hypothetical protein M0R89_11530 [Halorussus limi]
MANNQIYDAFQAALIPAFVVGVLSVPGFLFGGFEFNGIQLALDSTLTVGGVTATYGTVIAIVSYLLVGAANDAWSSVTDATTDDVERLVVGGELVVLALVPLLPSVGDIVTTTTWGGLLYAAVGLAAVYYVAYTR